MSSRRLTYKHKNLPIDYQSVSPKNRHLGVTHHYGSVEEQLNAL